MARRPDKGSGRQGSGRSSPERQIGAGAGRPPRRNERAGGKHDRPVSDERDPNREIHRSPAEARGAVGHPDDKLIRVAGLPSVAELFETGADRVERVYFESDLKTEVQGYCALLARRRKVYRQVRDEEMVRVAGTAMHGGVVALARPRPIRDFDLALAERWAAAGEPLLILDGVGNPQNIGAIARTAAFFGVRRLVLSDHPGQAGLSDAAYRVAKGGLDRIEIYRGTALPETLQRLAAHYHVAGTAIERGVPLNKFVKTGKPVALVMGNEEEGLPPATLAACASVVALTGSGKVQSLNVSAAAAILIHTLLVSR